MPEKLRLEDRIATARAPADRVRLLEAVAHWAERYRFLAPLTSGDRALMDRYEEALAHLDAAIALLHERDATPPYSGV